MCIRDSPGGNRNGGYRGERRSNGGYRGSRSGAPRGPRPSLSLIHISSRAQVSVVLPLPEQGAATRNWIICVLL